MKNLVKKLQEKAGFVSLEIIIVTGVVIALGMFGLKQYNESGKIVIDHSIDKMNEVGIPLLRRVPFFIHK